MIKIVFAAVLASVLIVSTGGEAADLKFFCPVAMRAVMADLIPQFERMSSHKVTVEYATVGAITARIVKGDAVDVAIVSARQADDLMKQGKIAAGGRADVARVGFAVFVRQGAPKPDVRTVDAFKRSLLAAKSITYGDPAGGGPSGIHMAGLVERLGIAAEVKPKTKLFPPGPRVMEAIAKGDAELGVGVASDTAASPGVDLVGPLPS